MGQRYRSIVCALVLSFAANTNLAAQQPIDDPFRAEKSESTPTSQPKSQPDATRSNAPKRPNASSPSNPHQAKERIEKVLAGQLREPMDFVAQPLSDVVTILEETYDIPIEFDTAALDAVAASPDVEVTVQINNVSLRSALDLMLQHSGTEELTYIIDDEVLLITTEQEAKSRLEVKVYRVDDLNASRPQDPRGASAWADFKPLNDIITSCVERESWRENGTGNGNGEIRAQGWDILVITQTSRVHEQIEQLLDDMRTVRAAIKSDALEQQAADAGRAITKGIRISDIVSSETDLEREVIQDLIKKSVDWDATGELSKDDIFLEIVRHHIFVRHIPHVVKQVEDVAAAMQLASINTGGGGVFGGTGGFGRPVANQGPKTAEPQSNEGRDEPSRGGGF